MHLMAAQNRWKWDAPPPTGGSVASSRRDTGAIRTWARENGHEVSERGRIPASVVEAYDAAH